MALPLMGIIGGGMQVAGSLIGSGSRKREARAAQAEFEAQKQAFQDFRFENQFAGLENTFEDATVNQQAAQFQGREDDQALAQALQAVTVSGGGSGAQAIAQAALQSKAGISADIAKQEAANQARSMQMAASLQNMEAQGASKMQEQQYGQSQQLLNLAAGRKQAADQARTQATAQLVGGLGSLAGGVGAGMMGGEGSFAKNLMTSIGGIPKQA
tara:strand:- start:1314 stop:1955 length:642 start_codon:yes stop_codon:yes gene_type:complete